MLNPLKKAMIIYFGKDWALSLWKKTQSAYEELLPLAEGESDSRQKNLKNSIYPFAALYRVLLAEGMEKDIAMEHMEAVMNIYTTNGNRKTYVLLGKLPFFFSLFRKMFSAGLKGDSWTVDWVANDSKQFVYTIRTCLWHEACQSLGHPELCRIFCRNDEINFNDVSSHLSFERSSALGYGDDCCDFHFYPKPPKEH